MAKIEIAAEQDRLTIATLLVKNGYTVRQGKEKSPNGKRNIFFIEYSKARTAAEEMKADERSVCG